MKIELNDNDALELKLLKRNLEDKLAGVRTVENKSTASHRRTTDEERELEHGVEVLGKILRQL